VDGLLATPFAPLLEFYFALHELSILARPIVDAAALGAGEFDELILGHNVRHYTRYWLLTQDLPIRYYSRMELQVGVKVLLKNRDGKYLLIRRAEDKYKEVEHKWDIPGGRINVDSDLLKNLIREVSEETGLEITSTLKLVAAQDIFNDENEKHIVRLTYIGTTEGEPRLSEEHTEYRWTTLEELRTMDDTDKYLKELLENSTIC
jgi:ADP-ribose pyrophosphatase YjhB (NUDIX family)